MSNPNTFINQYSSNIVQFVQLMQTLRTQNDQIAADPTLIERYFSQTPQDNLGGMPRKDIDAQVVNDAKDALVQMLFAFDSGEPTQKAKLFRMQP